MAIIELVGGNMMKKKETAVKTTGVITPIKEVVKDANVKTEAKVETVVKAENKKAEDKKVEAKDKEKAEASVKKSVAEKKTTKTTDSKTKATSATKAKSEKTVCNCYVQFGGREVSIETVQEWVKADFVAAGHKESEIKELKIYIKPEDRRAYYVVNENYTASISLA